MATNKNIPAFSAADIEKYHRGLLSNPERHALEKAALDDPFLADALEGYALPGLQASADIALLKDQLAARVEKDEQKVIPIGGQRRFPWLRAAAAILIIGGAGVLASQYIFNTKKPADIAQAEKVNPSTAGSNETADTAADQVNTAAANPQAVEDVNNTAGTKPGATTPEKLPATPTAIKPATEGEKAAKVTTVANNAPVSTAAETVSIPERRNAVTPAPSPAGAGDITKVTDDKATGGQINPGIAAKERAKDKALTEADAIKDKDQAVAASRKSEEQKYRNQQIHIFRGRVTDAKNAGVPFANVTNIEDKAGTYTDVNGYFNLTSPDTVLHVQVRSIGFENNQVQLKNSVASTKVVLQEDRSLSEVVLSNQKPNVAARNRDANRVLQEPEPADGWDNYDAYIANNLDIPEDIKTKQNQTGSVQVSFEVDKYGEPINFRVEKSLCEKCDKEAIRLIKDGPKWKRNANRNGRTTVTINF